MEASKGAGVPAQVRALVETIQRHECEHGFAPSVRELAALLGYSSPASVHRWVRVAQRLGLLRQTAGRTKRYVSAEIG